MKVEKQQPLYMYSIPVTPREYPRNQAYLPTSIDASITALTSCRTSSKPRMRRSILGSGQSRNQAYQTAPAFKRFLIRAHTFSAVGGKALTLVA